MKFVKKEIVYTYEDDKNNKFTVVNNKIRSYEGMILTKDWDLLQKEYNKFKKRRKDENGKN